MLSLSCFSVFFWTFCTQSLWCLVLYQKKGRDYDSCLKWLHLQHTGLLRWHYFKSYICSSPRFSALLPYIFLWLVKECAAKPALFHYVFCRVPQLVSSWTVSSEQLVWVSVCWSDLSNQGLLVIISTRFRVFGISAVMMGVLNHSFR